MKAMLEYNPNKRPSAAECLQFEYFKISIPIPMNASVSTVDEEDKEEFKQTFTHTRTKENFSAQLKKEVKAEPQEATISSLEMMKRARYKYKRPKHV
jgi:serine/threonine protein kinase